jgi:competence CoiA-like predicted nuclease
MKEGVVLIAKNQEGDLVSALETSLQRKESYSCPGCQGCPIEAGAGNVSAFCS